MAQSALTVTAPNPTPPTNFGSTGTTAPNPPNYTKLTYQNYVGAVGGLVTPANPPPYYDDGTAGNLNVYAANVAALASGTGATSGGTEGTYPGTGTAYANVNNVGAVPASTSAAHEEVGNVTTVTATGSRAECPTLACSDGPVMNTLALRDAGPNSAHASSLNASGTSTVTGATGVTNVSGPYGKTTTLTVTGTNFRRDSIVNVNNIPQTTNYVSATSLTVTNAPMRTSAGNQPVSVTTGGVTTANFNWVQT